jgi:hypothetical protein
LAGKVFAESSIAFSAIEESIILLAIDFVPHAYTRHISASNMHEATATAAESAGDAFYDLVLDA